MNDYLLGEVVRNYRRENHLSLRAFGEMCGISHTTIDCIEKGYDPRTGKRVNITNITFSKLADVLKIPVSVLVDLSVGIDNFHRVVGGWMTTSAMASVLAKDSENDASQSDDNIKKSTPVFEDGLNTERKQLTIEESNRLLVAMGFIEEGQDLSDDDLAFLTHIIGLLNSHFSKRGPGAKKDSPEGE